MNQNPEQLAVTKLTLHYCNATRLFKTRIRSISMQVWRAFEQLKQVSGSPKGELTALVSLIRRVSGIDTALICYDKTAAPVKCGNCLVIERMKLLMN